jgi:hypothetical protein
MKILLVSVSIEFPLANFCLAAQVVSNDALQGTSVDQLHLDWKRLSHYEQKNAEIWRFLAAIDRLRPDVAAFSVYLWNHLPIRELVTITRSLFPQILIVIGGPELATPGAAEVWLQSRAVDVVVRGEGERTFEEVVERFAQGKDTKGVLGTSRYNSGLLTHEPARAPAKDLGELASPFLGGLVSPELFDRGHLLPRTASYPRVLMETYRGCYMQCSYCQWGNGSKSRFAFPEDRLKRELTWLLSHNVREIFFVDAMFGYKKKIAIDLLEFIAHEKRRLRATTKFSLYHNQDFFDPQLLQLYRDVEATIEVDLQSTNGDVLNRLGRGRWQIDSFDRHLDAIRERHIPTTGGADLIIGIPGDDLDSFKTSVDCLLRRHMRVNLYQASILPDTAWSRSIREDETVFSSVPPRAILSNGTFPLKDMIAARLIGHGTDLFNNFPRTAEILWRRWFGRPVDLCGVVGEIIFEKHGLMYGESHQYDWVMGSNLHLLAGLIRKLCPDPKAAEILVELMVFEGALSHVNWSPEIVRVAATEPWVVVGEDWLTQRPDFPRNSVQRVAFHYKIHELLLAWDQNPDPNLLDRVAQRDCAVLFYNDGRPQYFAIDAGVTNKILQRLNGYFTVREVLDNLDLHWEDMSPVWSVLSLLAAGGLITRGERPALGCETRAPAQLNVS